MSFDMESNGLTPLNNAYIDIDIIGDGNIPLKKYKVNMRAFLKLLEKAKEELDKEEEK